MVNMDAIGGKDKEKYIKDVQKGIREEVTKQSPEADAKLKQSHKALNDYEFLKQQANLGEVTKDLDQVIEAFPDESQAIDAALDPGYSKQIVAKEGTDKLLSSMGKSGLEFRRRLDNITGVLKKNGYEELSKQVEMQVIKEAVENGRMPSKAHLKRLLYSSLAAGAGGVIAGPVGAVVGGAAPLAATVADIAGTKAQGALASGRVSGKLMDLLEAYQGSKLGKGIQKIAPSLPKVGAVLGGAFTAANAGESIGKTVASGDPEYLGDFFESELGLDLAQSAGKGLYDMSQGQIDSSQFPKQTDVSLEDTQRFSQDYLPGQEVPTEVKPISREDLASSAEDSVFKSDLVDPQTVMKSPLDVFKLPVRDYSQANEERKQSQQLKAKEKVLKEFKLKNKLTNLDNSSIGVLTSIIKENQSPAAQDYAKQLEDSMNLKGQERTSRLFGLMQQPGFRALIKKDSKEPQ
jgi:hypothetical protein